MIKKYIEYLKDNPEGYWFKRKLYGWGWTPVTRQGWLAVLVYIVFLASAAQIFADPSLGPRSVVIFCALVVIATAILIFIAYRKGEKPRWQWGKRK